ncbi:MAG: mannose-1-phosphate guanylyltransferase [Pseudomonadota bacterium]
MNICGKEPMVVETCNRLSPLAKDEEILVVLGEKHLEEARAILAHRDVHILAEPVGRNTAPCIGLGAVILQNLGCRDPVAFLPADHYIHDTKAFIESLSQAGKMAESGGIVTLGIVPTRPETGYGYIERLETLDLESSVTAYRVTAFVEKPDRKTAEGYLQAGNYYWNAGIFVARPEIIIKEIEQHLPELYKGLLQLKEALGTDAFDAKLKSVYDSLTSVSFDYGVMENTKAPVFVVPCDCGWSDVGSWTSLYELRSHEYDEYENLTEDLNGGQTLLTDCERVFVSNRTGRLIACLGIRDFIVVDTPDALLIADSGRAQDIKKIVERLRKDQKEALL